MKFIDLLDNLQEEFSDYGKPSHGGKTAYPIFKNPTAKDLKEIKIETDPGYGLRAVADKENKDVYLFDASLLHNDAIAALTGKPDFSSQRWVRGYVNLKGEIQEFYPDDEILHVIDWVTKGNVLTWPELAYVKDKALERQKKFVDIQKRLGKKPMVVRKQSHMEKEKLKAKLAHKRRKTLGETLQEQFVDLRRPGYYGMGNKEYGVYKNPTSQEFRQLIKEDKPKGIRVVIDRKEKDIYVSSAELLHDDLEMVAFGSVKPGTKDSRYYRGFANLKGEIQFFRYMTDPKILEEVTKWINKGTLKMMGDDK